MKLPELEHPEKYAGLYVFDCDGQTAVGYTADEVAVLLESERYQHGKVYRIHRALPDGTMELQGVPTETFSVEDGLFFYRNNEPAAKADFDDLARLVSDTPPPCRMKLQLARLAGEPETWLTAIIFPAEHTHEVGNWLNELNYAGGDLVEGGSTQVAGYYADQPTLIERRQLWPAGSISRPAEEVLASVRQPVQRNIA